MLGQDGSRPNNGTVSAVNAIGPPHEAENLTVAQFGMEAADALLKLCQGGVRTPGAYVIFLELPRRSEDQAGAENHAPIVDGPAPQIWHIRGVERNALTQTNSVQRDAIQWGGRAGESQRGVHANAIGKQRRQPGINRYHYVFGIDSMAGKFDGRPRLGDDPRGRSVLLDSQPRAKPQP